MIVTKALYNIRNHRTDKCIEELPIAWYQVSKRLQRLQTASGFELAIRFLGKGQRLVHGDVLFEDNNSCVVVNVLPCESIVIQSDNPLVLAEAAFEIGNKHLPIFWEDQSLVLPYENGIMEGLIKSGFNPKRAVRRLIDTFDAQVDPDTFKNNPIQNKPLKLIIK